MHYALCIIHYALSCSATYDEFCPDHAAFHLIEGGEALYLINKDVGGLLAHTLAALLHGGEHGVAGDGPLAVGESADTHVVGHTVAHALHCLQDSDGRVVVDGEEAVGTRFHVHDGWRYHLGVVAVVADAHVLLAHLQSVFYQCVVVAVEAVFGNLHRHGRVVAHDVAASRLDEMLHGRESAHVVVNNHARRVHTCANAVVEHEGYTGLHEFLEVVVLLRVLGLRHDYAAYLIFIESFADFLFALVALVALSHDDEVSPRVGLLLDTTENRGEVEVGELGQDDTDELGRFYAGVAQLLADNIRKEVVLTGLGLYLLTAFLADARIVAQSTRDGGDRYSEVLGYVAHGDVLCWFDRLIVHRC